MPTHAQRRILSGCAVLIAALLAGCSEPAETTTSMVGTTPSVATSTTAAASSSTSPPTVSPEPSPEPTTTVAAETPTTKTTLPPLPLRALDLEEVGSGFHQPTVVTSIPGDARLFVVERQGVIEIIDPATGRLDEPFLDLRDRVGSTGIEQGLLGMAFHPDYASNGRLFVYHVDRDGNRQLAEYAVGADPNRADADSEKVLLERAQPPDSTDIRHYAGNIQFGPDGYLYLSLGDGADFSRQGQDPNTVFASIVRLDVDGGDPYAIPEGNPFIDGGGAPEVWAYGLRNPWRFTIDHEARLLYVADVGQSRWEEVSIVSIDEAGYNFGWPIVEGSHCFTDRDCDMSGLTLPVIEYDHDDGCSITGGHVYRGRAIPEIEGHYFYADWCQGWVRSLNYTDSLASSLRDWSADLAGLGQPNTFGVGGDGELYIANFEGQVFKIVAVR